MRLVGNIVYIVIFEKRGNNKYKKLQLSWRTITNRQHELALSVSEQLYTLCQNEDVYYSIALDESADINDSP